jgi:hypothetical protein
MFFDFNSSFNLAEDNLLFNDNNTEDSKIFEISKIFNPNFQNQLDFPQIRERGIELGYSLKKDSSPQETKEKEGNF